MSTRLVVECDVHEGVTAEHVPVWDIQRSKVVSIDLCKDCRKKLVWLVELTDEHGADWAPPKPVRVDSAKAPGATWDCLLCKQAGYKVFNSLSGHYTTVHGIKPAGLAVVYNGQCPLDGDQWEQLGRHAASAHDTNIPGIFAAAVKAGDELGVVKANIARLMDLAGGQR